MICMHVATLDTDAVDIACYCCDMHSPEGCVLHKTLLLWLWSACVAEWLGLRLGTRKL